MKRKFQRRGDSPSAASPLGNLPRIGRARSAIFHGGRE
jgi:hypothetical protein